MTSFKEKEAYTSKYSIIETENGFRVEGRDRHTVHVRLAPNKTAFLVGFDESGERLHASLNLYAYRALLEAVATVAMSNWQRPQNPPTSWSGIEQWAIGRTKLALSSRVYTEWQRLLALVPETKRLVARAVFATTFSSQTQGCEVWDEIYEHPYFIKDILNYRAAATACYYAYELTWELGRHLFSQSEQNPAFISNQQQKRFIDFYGRRLGGDIPFDDPELFDSANPICDIDSYEP